MTNPYHFRAKIDRLWRQANSNIPGYKQLDALDAIAREIHAPTEQARRNQQMYFTTDPYDVARHLLRNLYDRADSTVAAAEVSLYLPLPEGEGWGEGHLAPSEEESPEEDDDPW